jgi:hypothetical protein
LCLLAHGQPKPVVRAIPQFITGLDEQGATMATDAEKQLDALLRRIEVECIPNIADVTVAFYGIQDGNIIADRTGVLLRIGSAHFIITAAHDLAGVVKNNIPLYVSAISQDELPIPLASVRFVCLEDEGVDFAVIELSKYEVDDLAQKRRFMTLHDIDNAMERVDAMYVLYGYPVEWLDVSKRGIVSKALVYSCKLYNGEPLRLSNYNADYHVLFGVDKEGIDAKTKEAVIMPDISGISGCGIWRVMRKDQAKTWKSDYCKLVAIEHSWSKGKEGKEYVKAT